MHYFSIERKYFPDFISFYNALLQKRSNLEYCSVFLILNYNSLIQLTKYGLPGKNRKIDCNRSQKDWCESQSQVLSKWQMTIWKNICGRPPLPPRERRLLCYTDFGAIKNHRLKRRTFCIFVLHYVCRYSKRWAALIKGRTFLHRQNLGWILLQKIPKGV